jgi:hypothetical protein
MDDELRKRWLQASIALLVSYLFDAQGEHHIDDLYS